MKVYISSDHGGYELKNKIIEHLSTPSLITLLKLNNLEAIEDLGPTTLEPTDDYTDFAVALSQKVQENKDSFGILICRSGIGVCIASNKFKGIYSALCFTEEHAIKAREHNNANVLCLDSDFGELNEQFKIVETFLTTKFTNEERHVRRIGEIKDIESENMK